MSAITIDDELVHYEVLGRGKPIILIHGWLGSWRYWVPTMQQMAMKYRCYAIDLWGFGDSGKDPNRYPFEMQLDLLDKFIDRMGMPKVVLVGHGLGAAIAAHYAIWPETAAKVHRMLVVSPPLTDGGPFTANGLKALTSNTPDSTSRYEPPPRLSDSQLQMPISQGDLDSIGIRPANPLKDIFAQYSLEELLSRATDSTASDYERLRAEIAKTDDQAVYISTEAFDEISTFDDLMMVETPVCALLGDHDHFLPRPQDSLLHSLDQRGHLKLLIMSNAQHFPMLEDKAQFVRLLKDFLEAPDVSSLEMKEEWRRRKR